MYRAFFNRDWNQFKILCRHIVSEYQHLSAPLFNQTYFDPVRNFEIENTKDINFPIIDESDVDNFDYDTIGKGMGMGNNSSSDNDSDGDGDDSYGSAGPELRGNMIPRKMPSKFKSHFSKKYRTY
ncbi:hypothetical protein SARC_01249 [Sphaeroforma arctica JP610]|uniref:Uncharacterized protein n=1 Tax=Sphaeroforma arctica JP610 TaxID=667725 RepID=A0A0L0GCA6_9EUKA|nr:hypothetical protein SARC_01249 [Sphaeroforma arctica JP610]KNC86620.1 hypothetical protein SARC_01249 [Sphaeroforma arctica JP610]|eukprot:XP_014160522.1 hypothetical protein SARC_01249 [Sphaeroforma arctica JP610]